MAIDLTACIGCSACVVACQAENNIPVVGKERGDARPRDALAARRPLLRRATTTSTTRRRTSSRCRACSARTPRASWSAPSRRPSTAPTASTTWSTTAASARATARTTAPTRCGASTSSSTPTTRPQSLKLLRNPDVTVRSRGVMEKCTYCVQRIRARRDRGGERGPADPRRRDRDRLPGGLPGRGDRLRRHERPAEPGRASCKDSPLNYGLLAELNTRPRTTYLAAVRNPNPELEPKARRHGTPPTSDNPHGETAAPDAAASSGRGTPSRSVTDKISSIVLTRPTPRGWWLGFWHRASRWS